MRYIPEVALKQLADIVGAEYVTSEDAPLRAAETGTYETGNGVSAIVRPANRLEVQECMRAANRLRLRIYPISSGRNWGYGSRMPAADNCVLLDLGRMNRIVDFSKELAYVTVEPGVTQAQLYEFLQTHGAHLWMDSTGASPQCSLIGNAVERGFGHTPYGDHFAHSCGLEVVLPQGDVIDTGLGRYPGAKAAPLYRWGVGPALDGLFSQSNFGIVTRMTIWLMPAPEYFQAYYFRCETEEGLAGIIDALRPLRLNGTLRSASHIANDYKVVQALQQYPWEQMEGETPLCGPRFEELRRDLKIGKWNGSGALYGTKAQVREAARLLRRALDGKASGLQFLDDRKLAAASRFAGIYEKLTGWNLKRTLAVLRPVYGLMKGIPTDQPLNSTYWRKRTPPPAQMNPDSDGCGLLWCSPIAACDGAQAREVTSLATDLILAHGFEPAISLTMLTERALACIVSIAYDRQAPGEDARALSCHRDLLEQFASRGYYSYRLPVGSMSAMGERSAYTDLLESLKLTLDPNGVLSPGRYIPQARRLANGSRTPALIAHA